MGGDDLAVFDGDDFDRFALAAALSAMLRLPKAAFFLGASAVEAAAPRALAVLADVLDFDLGIVFLAIGISLA